MKQLCLINIKKHFPVCRLMFAESKRGRKRGIYRESRRKRGEERTRWRVRGKIERERSTQA